jgi:hypothetical protein
MTHMADNIIVVPDSIKELAENSVGVFLKE